MQSLRVIRRYLVLRAARPDYSHRLAWQLAMVDCGISF